MVSLIVYVRNKPVLVNELINFATQYGTVQRQLLNEFEIPYALLDYNAKILWVNEQFTELTGKDKNITNRSRRFSGTDKGTSAEE